MERLFMYSDTYFLTEKQNRGKFKICLNIAENRTIFKNPVALINGKISPQSPEWYLIFYGISQQIDIFR